MNDKIRTKKTPYLKRRAIRHVPRASHLAAAAPRLARPTPRLARPTPRLLLILILAALPLGAAPTPDLHYTTSWIGNSFGGRDGKWTQDNVEGMFVSADGTVYANTLWDEGGREVGVYRNGRVIGEAGHTHGWGYLGGSEITANSHYVYFSETMDNEGGHLVDPETWPAKGKLWFGISRRLRSDISKPAPFPGGKGGSGDTLKSDFLVVDEAADGANSGIVGLAANNTRLYISDTIENQVRIYDADTMAPAGAWRLDRPGRIAAAADGTLWVIQTAGIGQPARILHFSSDGRPLPQTISFSRSEIPTALCLSGDRMLVADNGPAQNVRIYARLTAHPTLVGTFGDRGGVFTGVPGKVGPGRLHDLVGVGMDPTGDTYIAESGGGTDLDCYSPTGTERWRLLGLLFVDEAGVDPASPSDVFTKYDHFVENYANPTPGAGWTYSDFIQDRFKYPEDPRLHTSPSTVWVRRIHGKRFLYMVDMYSSFLQIYRFDEKDGAVAIPCGYFAKGPNMDHGKLADWPPNQPEKGEWIWRDGNGNGAFNAGEFDMRPENAPDLWGWRVDSRGDIWQATTDKGIRHFPLQGLDAHGSPIYSYRTMQMIPTPAPFNNLQRADYYPETDTMYLSGYTAAEPNDHGYWKVIGRVIACYDRWSLGNRTPRWQLVVSEPTTPGSEAARQGPLSIPASFCVEGDYLFTVSVTDAKVRVYNRLTGAYEGSMQPGPEVGGKSGWVDIPYGITAFRRKNGEYRIIVEEDWLGKDIVYRWER